MAEDMGFCTNDDYLENEILSPTDSSEDSVEVKVFPISSINKRQRIERRSSSNFNGPLKKRVCLQVKVESHQGHPFRPWSPSADKSAPKIKTEDFPPAPLPEPSLHTKEESRFISYFRPPSPINFSQQIEPVALIKKYKDDNVKTEVNYQDVRVPLHPTIQSLTTAETERIILKTTEIFPSLKTSVNSFPTSSFSNKKLDCQRKEQRNYKNMTRERRIEANARERTRVHTISAAFDTLRRSIPSYSHNQKLSKLSVLRIACSYIMTLSSIVADEAGSGVSTVEVPECIDMVSRTIQREGKLRKKKDDND
ncbi:hypothetical protein NQ315_000557 [Exocentrus adspersus]|uniref:BHLH domain-containing protein n=1 Tax=Exocentrus adspersus TaxID=1586481 RepID=A0AAV8VBG9_9CUCU|nr:hypothetical protein NQ315_000557 [Exocentrus adspersus]